MKAPTGGELRQGAEVLLGRAHLYPFAQRAYYRVFNRAERDACERRRALYRPFVSRGSLVFDIGANIGVYTATFLELGARVVAIEPNPQLARTISSRLRTQRLTVESVAVGADAGMETMRIGADPAHSTLATEWEPSDRFWAQSLRVPVVTLDDLIARHGMPDFVKVDVEGYEARVFSGLTKPISALSFEALVALPETYLAVFRRLADLGRYSYALEHDPMTWLDADAAGAAISSLPENGYTDLLARHQ